MTPLASWALVAILPIGAWCSALLIEHFMSKPKPGRHRKVKRHD